MILSVVSVKLKLATTYLELLQTGLPALWLLFHSMMQCEIKAGEEIAYNCPLTCRLLHLCWML